MLSDVPLEKGPKACRILVEVSEGVPRVKDRQKQSWAEESNCPVDTGERPQQIMEGALEPASLWGLTHRETAGPVMRCRMQNTN